jgi:hypothetical protein
MRRWIRTTVDPILLFADLFETYVISRFSFILILYYFLTLRVMLKNVNYTEPVFVNLLREPRNRFPA